MEIILERYKSGNLSTNSKLDVVNGVVSIYSCFALELPWKENKPQISCVPAATYPISIYQSPTKGEVLLLHDVPGRSYIEIHVANKPSELLGCIAPGTEFAAEDFISNSRKAFNEIMKYKEKIKNITIVDAFKN